MSSPLPALMDVKTIAGELQVAKSVAERIMRQLPKRRIGRRVFVDRADVAAYLDQCRLDKDGFPA